MPFPALFAAFKALGMAVQAVGPLVKLMIVVLLFGGAAIMLEALGIPVVTAPINAVVDWFTAWLSSIVRGAIPG